MWHIPPAVFQALDDQSYPNELLKYIPIGTPVSRAEEILQPSHSTRLGSGRIFHKAQNARRSNHFLEASKLRMNAACSGLPSPCSKVAIKRW